MTGNNGYTHLGLLALLSLFCLFVVDVFSFRLGCVNFLRAGGGLKPQIAFGASDTRNVALHCTERFVAISWKSHVCLHIQTSVLQGI